MRIIKYLIGLVMLFVLIFTLYTGYVLATASWYPGLNLNTDYTEAYFEKKLSNLVPGFYSQASKVQTLSLSDKESEGLLKLAVKQAQKEASYVNGIAVNMDIDTVEVSANLIIGSWKKGLSVVLRPMIIESSGDLAILIKQIRIGKYPMPVTPLVYIGKWVLPEGLPFKSDNSYIRISMGQLPVVLEKLKIEPAKLSVGVSMSGLNLAQITGQEKELVQAAINQSKSLQEGLASKEARDFIAKLPEKQSFSVSDIEKAREIYESLSPQDRAMLEKNLGKYLADPEISKVLAKYGIGRQLFSLTQ